MARRVGGAGGGSDPGAGKAGAVVVAGVPAISVAAGSGGLSLGGGTSAIDSVGTNLTRTKSEGRKSARKRDADGGFTDPRRAAVHLMLLTMTGDPTIRGTRPDDDDIAAGVRVFLHGHDVENR